MEDTAIDWTLFLGRAPGTIDRAIVAEHLHGKRVLITGAGGSIGSALARKLLDSGVDRLLLLDISEGGLFDLAAELEGSQQPSTESIVGDVCDSALLREVFAEQPIDIVFHAAACKHVSLMEANPFMAARSNIVGTLRLLKAASEARAGQVIVISTDKAADPAGIMGATKRVGELLVISSKQWTNKGVMQVKAVRLANVLGSSGSVVPVMLRQIARGIPLTITDLACTRYFISMEEAVRHLVCAIGVESSSTVLVPESGEPFPVLALSEFLIARASRGKAEPEIVFKGLRSGEKLTERMISGDEESMPTNLPELRQAIERAPIDWSKLGSSIEEIEAAIESRDLDRLLRTITALVPAYKPSSPLQRQAEQRAKMVP